MAESLRSGSSIFQVNRFGRPLTVELSRQSGNYFAVYQVVKSEASDTMETAMLNGWLGQA